MATCNPDVFNFYTYLRTHPLLLRRHFGSSDKGKVGLTAEGRRADSISLEERRLFFTAAYAHLQAGCPMLALEILSKMPKVCRHSKLPTREVQGNSPKHSVESKEGQTSDPDWSQPSLNGYESDGNSFSKSESVLSFDWSQPSLALPDEPLELKWDSDKENNDDDEEGDRGIKNAQTSGMADNVSVFHDTQDTMSPMMDIMTEEDTEDSSDFIAPIDDVFVAQLKFAACLKMLTNELRTLSTGYEVDGGKLRYQLYQWLEREVTCTHTHTLI